MKAKRQLSYHDLLVAEGKLDGALGVGDERNAEIDSGSSHSVTVRDLVAVAVGNNDGKVDLAALEGVNSKMVLVTSAGLVDGDQLILREVHQSQSGVGTLRGVDGAVEVDQVLHRLLELVELLGRNGNQDAATLLAAKLGELELEVGREDGLDEGLARIVTVAGDLSRGSHLDTKSGIGSLESGEGEHGGLAADVVQVLQHDGAALVRKLDHDTGRKLDEVEVEGLGHEGEGTGGSQVALDNLDGIVLGEHLDVEGAGDLQLGSDLGGDELDSSLRLAVESLGGEQQGGITGVDAGVLDVLGNGVVEDLTLLSNTIELDLLGALDELGEDDGVVGGDLGGSAEALEQTLFVVGHGHGGAGEDEGRTDQDGVGSLSGELEGLLVGGDADPGWLVDVELVEHVTELGTVLGLLDHVGVGTEDVHAVLVERKSEVVGDLASDGDDDTLGLLQLVDIEDTLHGELLEVEAVALIVVGGDGLRVEVDDDGVLVGGAEGADAGHGAVVEFDGAADGVGAAAEDDDAVVVEVDVVLGAAVGEVEVVGLGGELGGEGINLLDDGGDAEALSVLTHDEVGLETLGVGDAGEVDVVGDLVIAEAEDLEDAHLLLGDGLEGLALEEGGGLGDVAKLVEEPVVDLGEVVDLLDGHAVLEGVGDGVDSAVVGLSEQGHEDVLDVVLGGLEAVHEGVDHTDGLLDGLLEVSADGHDLTDGLHAGAEAGRDLVELLEVPAGHLDDAVIEGGLEAGGGGVGDAVLDLDEVFAEGELGGDVGQGVAGGLGGEGGGAGETGVDLDDAVLLTLGVEGVLDVALTDDAKVADHADGGLTQLHVLAVGEGLGGGDDDRVTGVDTQGVEVLHVADGDAVVEAVAHDLVLDLLPAAEVLVDEDLLGAAEGLSGEVDQRLVVGGEAAAEATEGEGGTDEHGIADAVGDVEGLLDAEGGGGGGELLVDLQELLLEELAVLSVDDGLDGGAEDLDVVLLEDLGLVELDTDVQGGLTTHRDEDGVGALLLDDLGDELGGDGEEVDARGHALAGLDGGDVGVDEDDLDVLLLQGLDGLGARVVELAGLTDGEAAGAEDEDLVDAGGLEEVGVEGVDGLRDALDGVDELVEEEAGVEGTGAGLRVELGGEEGLGLVEDALVGGVVDVEEEGRPAFGKGLGDDVVAVVL